MITADIFECIRLKKNCHRGESAALDRCMPWANRFFFSSKSMKGKILNFLHEVKKMISVSLSKFNRKKIGFPFLKKRAYFQETKVNFLFQVFLY